MNAKIYPSTIISLKKQRSIYLYRLLVPEPFHKRNKFYVDELKKYLYCEYMKGFATFKKKVLDPCVEDINRNSEVDVKYFLIYSGNKVKAVEFFTDNKSDSEEMNPK